MAMGHSYRELVSACLDGVEFQEYRRFAAAPYYQDDLGRPDRWISWQQPVVSSWYGREGHE